MLASRVRSVGRRILHCFLEPHLDPLAEQQEGGRMGHRKEKGKVSRRVREED